MNKCYPKTTFAIELAFVLNLNVFFYTDFGEIPEFCVPKHA